MIINEKRCSRNTGKLAFDSPWKVGIYYGTAHKLDFKNCYATFVITCFIESRILPYVYSHC